MGFLASNLKVNMIGNVILISKELRNMSVLCDVL